MGRRKKAMNRRTFLKGANAAIAIPFLDAMIPTFAYAQSSPQYRWVNLYYGSVNGGLINPSSTGTLTAPLRDSIKSLENVKQHISILSKVDLIQINNTLPGPGQASQATHGKVESPMLSGVRSIPKSLASQHQNAYSFVRGTTADQIAAQYLGSGSKFNSLQIRTQAADYNNTNRAPKAISVVKNGSILNELRPTISPLQIYEMLFSNGIPSGGNQPPVSSLPLKKKSVLDLVLDDANRLENSVNGKDKERLQQHFENIREIERSLASTNTPPPSGGSCSLPTKPGADPAISTRGFGGWANETLRGEQQAQMVAHALSCGLTHVVSWAITHHQSWINSQKTGNSTFNTNQGLPDIHGDSHQATGAIRAANHNWAANFFGLLVKRLSELSDAHGTILDHTFLTFFTAEGPTAHGRTNMTYLVAGCPDRMKNGVHINSSGSHPAQVLISGLKTIGMNTNTLGEVSGTVPGLLK